MQSVTMCRVEDNCLSTNFDLLCCCRGWEFHVQSFRCCMDHLMHVSNARCPGSVRHEIPIDRLAELRSRVVRSLSEIVRSVSEIVR